MPPPFMLPPAGFIPGRAAFFVSPPASPAAHPIPQVCRGRPRRPDCSIAPAAVHVADAAAAAPDRAVPMVDVFYERPVGGSA